MKAGNLQILKDNGFRVPAFTVVERGEDADLSFSGAEFFAVRSSFALEDGGESSFAGQFKTLLHVPRGRVPDAVRQVRESYRRYRGDETGGEAGSNEAGGEADSDEAGAGSPVIVQEMIEPELAGVVFTATPMGILNEAVITAGRGLGDGVVEDRIQTVTYYYNRDEALFYLKEESAPGLDRALLKELIEVSDKVRDLFGWEADMEFAVREGTVYVLQARPITAIKTGKPLVLDNSNIVESYPGISLPLTQDFVGRVYRDIFKSCVRRLTGDAALLRALEPVLEQMVAGYQGGLYYVINNWYTLLQILPFSGKIIPVWQEMLGVGQKIEGAVGVAVTGGTKLRVGLSFLRELAAAPRSMKRLNAYFDKVYPQFAEQVQKADTPEALLRALDEIECSVMGMWDITLINDMYTFLFTALAGGGKNGKLAEIKDLESMKPVTALNELRKIAAEQGTDSDAYQAAEQAYLAAYGDRIYGELKLETKTYRTHPALLRQQVLSGQYTPARESAGQRSLNPFVGAAKKGIANREQSRLNRSRLFGLAREIARKAGALLVENGQLEAPEDIFYLYLDEIDSAADRRALVRQRKAQWARYEAAPHPRRLVFTGELVEDQRTACGSPLEAAAVLHGAGTSPGEVTAEAIVLEEADASAQVCGKIIVTKSTDPGWVFLLEQCAGIIAERGSLLSHTAIISRELKKPAVVNVKDAAAIIGTGDLLHIDAGAGTVNLLKRADGHGVPGDNRLHG